MNISIPRVPVTAIRTAVTVMNSATDPTLCPFFGKCDGIVIIDAASGSKVFHPNVCRTPQSLCDLIAAAEPDRVVCGYIGETEKRRLRAAGRSEERRVAQECVSTCRSRRSPYT